MDNVIVTEADREVAEKAIKDFYAAITGNDNWSLPEAFARHRTEATRQAEADKAELVEALQELLTHSCVSESAPEDKLPEDHAAESNARALIRKHGGNHVA